MNPNGTMDLRVGVGPLKSRIATELASCKVTKAREPSFEMAMYSVRWQWMPADRLRASRHGHEAAPPHHWAENSTVVTVAEAAPFFRLMMETAPVHPRPRRLPPLP